MQGEGTIRENCWQTSEHPLLHEGVFQIYYKKGGLLVKSSELDEGYNSDDSEKGNFSDTQNGARQMEGVLRFVPGSVLDPTGNAYDVRIEPFLFDGDLDFMYIA